MYANLRLAFVVLIGVLLPFVVPQYSLTVLIEALIFGLFAMSLDLMVGYCRLYSFGHAAAYGLGAYAAALILIASAAAVADRHRARGRGHGGGGDPGRLGLHALDRGILRHADAGVRAARLRHGVPLPRRHRRLGRSRAAFRGRRVRSA